MFLTDHLFRDSMLKNGMDALIAGYDSENIILLSCASSELDSELISTFISAAYELGVKLPKTDKYGVWVADSYFDLVEAGIDLPAVGVQAEFKRYLIYEVMALSEYRAKNEGLLMWWPLCNVVLQYFFVGVMYSSKNRGFYAGTKF